jgi:hypothetical protein
LLPNTMHSLPQSQRQTHLARPLRSRSGWSASATQRPNRLPVRSIILPMRSSLRLTARALRWAWGCRISELPDSSRLPRAFAQPRAEVRFFRR